MLIAMFFIIVPHYGESVEGFFNDITQERTEVASGVFLPAPQRPHPEVYSTAMRFCIVFGLFQFFILALRLYFKSSVSKMAETISNIVFWLGVAYMFNLLWGKTVEWFPFIGGIIAVIGFSIVVRSLITLLFWRRSSSTQ